MKVQKTETITQWRVMVFDMQLVSPTVVAVQHGSLTVIAPWLDISKPLNVKRCFGFKVVKGRLGVLASDGPPNVDATGIDKG